MDRKLVLPPITTLYPMEAFHKPPEPASQLPPLLQSPPGHTPHHQHTRSYSDYSHPFASLPTPVGLVRPEPRRIQTQQQHRRTVSSSATDSMVSFQQEATTKPRQPSPPPRITMTPNNSKELQQHHQHQQLSSSSSTPTPCPSSPTSTSSTEGTDKYKCAHCGKGFSRPSSLKIHVYSHTGEKPFDCPEPGCGRRFNVQSNLRRHLRTHRVVPKSLRRFGRGSAVRVVPIAPARPRFI